MAKRIPFSRKELFGGDGVRRFSGRHLDEIAFPLGGIGTGSVSLGGWGQLRDWEIFNRPNKGFCSGTSFFALHVSDGKKPAVVRVLQGQPGGSYATGGHGLRAWNQKLPAFRQCEFEGQFPFARVSLKDSAVPVDVGLEAFNPFIPLDSKNSSLPVAILRFHLRSRATRPVRVRMLALLENLVGFPDMGGCRNEVRPYGAGAGVAMTTVRHEPGSPRYGSMAILSPFAATSGTAQAFRPERLAEWAFWHSVATAGDYPCSVAEATSGDTSTLTAGLMLDAALTPQEAVTMPVIIAWYAPVSDAGGAPWETYVGTVFDDAWDAATYAAESLADLTARTRRFTERLFSSTLPGVVREAVSSQLSILKSPTCLRFADGKFWGWEGSSETSGCCAGTCMHVWNYAQALPYLFPELARSVREQHFELNMDDEGRMCFRQPLPPGTTADVAAFHPAADGQLGGVLKVYREWLISGDDDWLRRVWPSCRRSLEFAWVYWDPDRDGVIDGVQHNTYDNEFWGPNTMIGTFYLGALKAAAAMARYLDDDRAADGYERVFRSGRDWIEANLFTGRWYRQLINPDAGAHSAFESNHLLPGEALPRWQYGEGCLSDQLIGQWYAEMLGLDPLLGKEHIRTTLKSIFRYNWRPDLSGHACLLRAYALGREAGLLLCSWPGVPEPAYPFWFSSEVWCGIEYQIASHMIYEGMLSEALCIVKGVRDRHNGARRNPYDEFECGHHYSRSLASYGLLLAFSGFSYHAAEKRMGFAPRDNADDFGCFYCVGDAWGYFEQRRDKNRFHITLTVDEGRLCLRTLALAVGAEEEGLAVAVLSGGTEIAATMSSTGNARLLRLGRETPVLPGVPLVVELGQHTVESELPTGD